MLNVDCAQNNNYADMWSINKNTFQDLYSRCFDEDGNIILCGRDACKELIRYLGPDFGDAETGFMNAERIRSLYKAVSEK